ncbi:MAG: hypothetical protein PHR64_02460 [Candidatus Shapirobacteria bacterium]|nr:hypothetical protein [Candidatus Shapirobacteria bacterium]MDD5073693.1 hypothetical protein [Candidatus Shapirobacteria bacterium]MDD5481786.1 hypothetical protein [Candidatus Shapirobacteria bacterium]
MSQEKIFLAVGISLDRVKVVFWSPSLAQTDSDQINLLGEGAWETHLDDNGLLAAAETSYQQAKSFLLPDQNSLAVRPSVVFAVPQHWIDNNSQITPEKSRLLKEISVALGGRFLGFSSEAELLLAHFKNQENDSLVNLVAVSFGQDKLGVFPVVRGQVLGVQVVDRSDDIALDLEEGLARFNFDQPFPPRILIVGAGGGLDTVRSDLLGYSWVEPGKSAFMHLPKVEIFPYQKVLTALIDQAKDFLPEIEDEEPGQSEPETASPFRVLTPVKEEAIGALGFVKNQDVASFDEAKTSKRQEPVSEQEKSKSSPQFPRFKLKFNFDKTKSFLAKIKPSQPKKLGGVGRFDSENERPSLPIPALIILAIVLLVGLLLAAWWYFPKAELVLSVVPKYSEDNVSLLASTEVNDISIEEKIIPAHQVSAQVEKKDGVGTTGEDLVGEKAEGEATIYNRTTIERTFEEGTVLVSSNGLRFLTKSAVTVEPAVIDVDEDYNQVSTPSKKTVAVVAEDIGADYNLSADQEFVVDSFIKDNFVAKNGKVFSGGSSQKVRVVSKEDKEDLKEKVMALVKDQGEKELTSQSVSGERLIKESMSWSLTGEDFSHGVGDETDQLTLTLTARLTGLAYWEQDLNNLIEAFLEAQIPNGFVLGEEKRADFKFVEEQEAGVLFNLNFGASLYPDINETEIKKKIAGRRLTAIEDYLSLLPSVNASEVRFDPPLPEFLLTLPHRADNITITMEVGE